MTIELVRLSQSTQPDAIRRNFEAISRYIASTVPLLNGQESEASINWANVSNTPTTIADYGITDAQPLDADLTAIAGLTSAADSVPYFTGSGTAALATFTSAGRALVDDADAAAQRTTLSVPKITVSSSSDPTSGDVTDLWLNKSTHTLFVCHGGTTWSQFSGVVKP